MAGLRLLVANWLDRENPQAGGAEEHLHQMFGRLAERGHEVHLVTSGFPGASRTAFLDGLHVHRVGRRYTFGLFAAGLGLRVAGGRPFDVVVEDLNKVPLFTPTWRVSGPRLLLVHHLFGGTAFQEANLPLAAATWLLERPIPAAYAGVPTIAVSESTRDDLIQRGVPPENISVVTNGVTPLSPGAPGDRFTEPTFLYLGRLKRYKGIDVFLRAMRQMADEGLVVRFIVAGKGDDEPRLRTMVETLGLADQVEFRGFVSEAEKAELFQRSWVHVLPSAKEGWGITVLEAATAGTPSIAADSPGLRESVRHGETGLLAPHGSAQHLAEAAKQMILVDERERMGAAARRWAEGFSWDAKATELEERLGEVANGWGGRWKPRT